jgi:polysaccharide export outer membrane protein
MMASSPTPKAAPIPITLGTPTAATPVVRASDAQPTVWRTTEHEAGASDHVVASTSSWRTVDHSTVPASPDMIATLRPAVPVATIDTPAPVVTASMKGGLPNGAITTNEPPPSVDTPPLPQPRPLSVDTGRIEPPIVSHPAGIYHHGPAPNELNKVPLPPYIIEAPDILLVEIEAEVLEKKQPVRGQHLVRPDGSINLGIYGSVQVSGLTTEQAKTAVVSVIKLTYPESKIKTENVNVDVLAYNSKVYYVITDGGGYGEQVYRAPYTGNETVLDAISLINGLPPVASKKHIWVARRVADHGHGTAYNNILPVDWNSIASCGSTSTNYQLFPGDRVYVRAEGIIKLDSTVAKFISPIERMLGVTLLGSETVNSIKGRPLTTP